MNLHITKWERLELGPFSVLGSFVTLGNIRPTFLAIVIKYKKERMNRLIRAANDFSSLYIVTGRPSYITIIDRSESGR